MKEAMKLKTEAFHAWFAGGVCRSSGKLSESSGKGNKLRRPTAEADWRCTCVVEGAL